MTTATSTAPASVLDAYQLVDADEVRALLAARPFMEPLLAEVAAELPKYFSGAPLRLEVGHDPDGHDPPELILSIIVAGWGVEAVQDTLDRFDSDWWLDRYDQARGLLLITIAFG